MPITVKCGCGRKLTAKEEMAGKKAKCPNCNTVLTLPPPIPREEEPVAVEKVEVVDDEPEEEPDERRPRRRTGAAPRKKKSKYKHTALFDKSRPMFDEGWQGAYGGFVSTPIIITVSIVFLAIVGMIIFFIFLR